MDPIQSINIKKDTSFAMLLDAQKRGYELFYMEMGDLYLQNGKPMTTAAAAAAPSKRLRDMVLKDPRP